MSFEKKKDFKYGIGLVVISLIILIIMIVLLQGTNLIQGFTRGALWTISVISCIGIFIGSLSIWYSYNHDSPNHEIYEREKTNKYLFSPRPGY